MIDLDVLNFDPDYPCVPGRSRHDYRRRSGTPGYAECHYCGAEADIEDAEEK